MIFRNWLFLFVLSVGLFASYASAQKALKAIHVNKSIYMLEGKGGNIGVSVGDDGVLIVDDKFVADVGNIRKAIKAIKKGKLEFVLNTHYHGDHTGGNKILGKTAHIIAHSSVRKRLLPDSGGEGLPVITFEDSLSIHFNGEEIKMVHFPHGHTDGDSVVIFSESNVVHMGDHFFAERFPYIDINSGGTVDGFIQNVEDIIKDIPADAKIIPGHGPVSSLEGLKTFHRMMKETYEFIKVQKKNGLKLNAVKKVGVPEAWDGWGWGFISEEKWITMLYESL